MKRYLCMKIINSVVVVGLYYGFLTSFSIGPAYLLILRAQGMEEGTEKQVAGTTGFITGQLMMFISIYYAPLHLALGRPHTITALALPYLSFHFFWNNHKHFFDYGSTIRNSMRHFSTQSVFLNNFIFTFFNHFILPSSMLARLVNIYMFRCNNKMLFVTSSFVGWLMGHFLFMKGLGLVLVWIRYKYSIRANKYNKYRVLELRNSMARIFSILLFITCVYDLGRIPTLIITNKWKETSKMEEREEERDVEIETSSEMKGTKQEQERSAEEDSFFSEEREDPIYEDSYNENHDNSKFQIFMKNKYLFCFWFKKTLMTLLFDSNRWYPPFRYIKNNRFENAVRNEMSQYFFDTCQSAGKERISFTYPPGLETLGEMIKRRISLPSLENNELYNHWVYTNNQKSNNLNNEFGNRIQALDKESLFLNILETRTRLCNDNTRNEYLPPMYDPFLNGPYRRTITKSLSPSIIKIKKTSIDNFIEKVGINRIDGIVLPDTDHHKTEQKIDRFDKKPLSTEIVDFFYEFGKESGSNFNSRGLSVFSDEEEGSKEIRKKVPRWVYKLTSELELEEESGEDQENEELDPEIRSRNAKYFIILPSTKKDPDPSDPSDPSDEEDGIALINYSDQSDFRRGIINGSIRAQRRKVVIWKLFQANAHSPVFLDRIKKFLLFFSFDISGPIKRIFRDWVGKGSAFQIVEYTEEQTKREEKKEENENARMAIARAWETTPYGQEIRGCMLIAQSIFRKYILLPSLIIAKNIGRMLLLQLPEWYEDLQEWNSEIHVKCTYNGVQLSETEFPLNWLTEGIQIKILFPFRLKPWHRSKFRFSHNKDLIMKKKKENHDFCFLTVWGLETELPFGSPRERPLLFEFFEPIFKELEKKIGKFQKKSFLRLKIFKGKRKIRLLRKVSKETKKWVIKSFIFLKKIKEELFKVNPILLFRSREVEVYESGETKKERDPIISNQMIHESSSQIASPGWTNSSLTEKKMKDLTDRTNTIRNQIEIITKEKKKVTPEINISLNKTSSNAKRLEKRQILKRRNTRLIRKLPLFIKFFIEIIYTNIFLSIINIPRMKTKLFLESTKKIMNKSILFVESTKKIMNKSIYNNETNQEIINKKNQNPIEFISTIKKSLYNISNSKTNSHIFSDLSYLSQAYVFYKLSQTQVINLYKLKSFLQYQEIPFFLKPEIKDSFETQGIVNSKLRDNRLPSSEMNQWKNWLRGHYQYDLSQIRWSRLIPQQWRNRVYQRRMVKRKNFSKWNSYEKDQLIDSKKPNIFEVYSLSNQKDNFQKYYKYDLLSYKSINSENKKDSFISRSPFEGNKNQEISYNYNTYKDTFFDMMRSIPINNYLGKGDILYMEKTPARKYLDWKIINFDLRKKVDIEAWITIDANSNQNTKIVTNNSQIIDKKKIFYLNLMIPEMNLPNPPKVFFDWMGMNEKILKCPILNLELWFFPEFLLLYNTYKKKPWFIPSKLLLLNLNRNQKKKINEKQKGSFLIPSNKKIKNRNQEEKKTTSQGDLGSVLSNQQKDIEEDYYARSDMKKGKKKKKTKSAVEAELYLSLKHHFLFQLKQGETLNQRMMNNIKVYCFLLRLIDPRKISISSVQRGEMSLDIMLIHTNYTLPELMKRGILIIDPVRLSVENDGQFIMYQTIGISLVHKSKHQTNQRYREQRYVAKNHFDESIPPHERITRNRDKNHLDLLVPENILSFRRRRKLRILSCFNSKNRNDVDRNPVFCNEKNSSQVLGASNHLDRETNPLMKLKFFLWPNYRLEDLACMNRYWFDTNNGSRFSMLRIHLYPRLKIRR
nr:Ycf1 [Syringa tigerstedtii]